MAETGYAGTELGDWGFMPTDPARLRDELGSRGLALVGSWVSVRLQDRAYHETSAADAVRTAAQLAIVGGPEQRRRSRQRPVRRPGADEIRGSSDARSGDVRRAVGRLRDRGELGRPASPGRDGASHGLPPAHRDARRDRRRDASAPREHGRISSSGCVSTPATGRSARARIRWPLSPSLPRGSGTSISRTATPLSFGPRARTTGMGRPRSGTACSASSAQATSTSLACSSALDRTGYAGWIVVEQDVLPGMGTPRESARRNREYLRSIGA